MKSVTKLAAVAILMGLASPAFATMNTNNIDADATTTNPMVNQKDTIKGDTAPHANAPASIEPKAPKGPMAPVPMGDRRPMPPHDKMMKPPTPEQRAEMHKRHEEKMKNMTPAQREEARKKWEARRAEYEKMTPAERAAAKAKWEARKGGQKGLDKEERETNVNGGVASEVAPAPAVQ